MIDGHLSERVKLADPGGDVRRDEHAALRESWGGCYEYGDVREDVDSEYGWARVRDWGRAAD
jgi:hypothetical protein